MYHLYYNAGEDNGMYKNIGGKIKGLAIGMCTFTAVGAFIAGIVLLVDAIDYAEELIPVALLVMLVGPVLAWLFSWTLYGFGELIDKTCAIERNIKSAITKSDAQAKIDAQRISQIEHLRDQGLITESEYRQVMSKYQ